MRRCERKTELEKALAMAALELLAELESGYLEVCKVPSRHGGYIRVPVSVNHEWYRRFCRMFLSRNRRYPRPRTLIRRCHTIEALRRIAAGNTNGVYAERLMPFITEKAELMREEPAVQTQETFYVNF